MPNIKNVFARRRSGNALDDTHPDAPPNQSSFRVLERNDKVTHSFDRPPSHLKPVRPFQSPLQQQQQQHYHHKSAEDLISAGVNRGSGGTTNSGSSGYYESSNTSARHSSSSTLPSSVDQEREQDPEEDELFPVKKSATTSMQPPTAARADDSLPPPPSFSSRAARAFSFGQKHNRRNSSTKDSPPIPPLPSNGAASQRDGIDTSHRDRSTTISSYASTAVPTKPDVSLRLSTTSFGGDDWGNMFDGIGKSRSKENLPAPSPPNMGGFHRTESEPMFPPRTLSRQIFTPSPPALRDAGSPYSTDGRDSPDALMPGSALSSPRLDEGPTVAPHTSGIAPAFLGRSKAGYTLVPERNPSPGFERMSSDSYSSSPGEGGTEREKDYGNRQTHLNEGETWTKRVELRDGPPMSDAASNDSYRTARRSTQQATAGASRPGATSPGSSEGGSLFGGESRNTTPRAARVAVQHPQDGSTFESSPLGPPSRAIKPDSQHTRTASGTPKKMTRAQFEALRRDEDGLSDVSAEEEAKDLEDEYDDDDEVERGKKLARQRAKNEANLSVYRQQMKKVTGGGPADLPSMARPSLDRQSHSTPSLHIGGVGGTPPSESVRGKQSDNDDDEDVPLGILQAHGFPAAARPPTRQDEREGQRRASVAGSIVGGGAGQGNLPPFARRLPADPYYGASVVNPSHRESLAFGSAQSIYGGAPSVAPPPMQSQMGHPGGLVGVIAGEERARAARRGSPNPITGTFNPLPSNIPAQIPGLPRTMSTGSMALPQTYTPSGLFAGMPVMPQMPMMMPPMAPQPDLATQQMQQFMQMQMQVMQNMLAMQQQQMGQSTPSPQPQSVAQDYLGVQPGAQRPMSVSSQAGLSSSVPNHGRAMTMLNPPPSWNPNNVQQRPTSLMPSNHAPSVKNMTWGGPGPGYTPSIAPSERSNVGLAPRYRPVSTAGDSGTGRSHSLTSSVTLQTFSKPQSRPESQAGLPTKSTIRLVDKPKGTPKVHTRAVDPDDDEDDGWAEMAKKRTEKKTGRRKLDTAQRETDALKELYAPLE